MRTLRIATRKSELALWQAHHVRDRLLAAHADLDIELAAMRTEGDRILDVPLSRIGGKGLFIKELEQGIYDGRADLAVHSMKDVPSQLPPGMCLPVVCRREDPSDAFVSVAYARPADLPVGARVGTSSLRRRCQLLNLRPDLRVGTLRGNVNTRLSRLDAGEFDAIVLATAGLLRLGLGARIRARFAPEEMLPAAGQGAVGVECRDDDDELRALLEPLHDDETALCVAAERAVNVRLEGSCQVPIACHARLDGSRIAIQALLGMPDGQPVIFAEAGGPAADAHALSQQVADALFAQGAADILEAMREQDAW